MESNTCEYRLQRGARTGQLCGQPEVVSEKFCMICIMKDFCQPQVSEKFKNYRQNLNLMPLALVEDRFFYLEKYRFVVDYNGEVFLKGVFDGFEDDQVHYKMREATEEEKVIALIEGIKLI
jgi:hypothetical protein